MEPYIHRLLLAVSVRRGCIGKPGPNPVTFWLAERQSAQPEELRKLDPPERLMTAVEFMACAVQSQSRTLVAVDLKRALTGSSIEPKVEIELFTAGSS